MPLTAQTRKAHSNCTVGSYGDHVKPSAPNPFQKSNTKTPYRTKQTPTHRRNVFRQKITPVKNLERTSSCQNLYVTQTDVDITQCKRANSYEDIAAGICERTSIIHVRKFAAVRKMSDSEESVQTDVVGKTVIEKACTAFLLYMWKHKRREVTEIKKQIKDLEHQSMDMRVQIMSLYQLLESEKSRLASANYKAMQQHFIADEAMLNNRALNAVNTSQMKEISELNKQVASLQTECNNQKNELIVAKQEIFSLHTQMDKERVKVSKLREDKKVFMEKAQSAEAEVKRKEALLVQQEAEQKLREEDRVILLQQVHESSMIVETMQLEKDRLHDEIQKSRCEEDEMRKRLSALEKCVEDKENEIVVLKKTCSGYMVEAVQLKLSQLKPSETTDESWMRYISQKLTATMFCIILPLIKAAAFP